MGWEDRIWMWARPHLKEAQVAEGQDPVGRPTHWQVVRWQMGFHGLVNSATNSSHCIGPRPTTYSGSKLSALSLALVSQYLAGKIQSAHTRTFVQEWTNSRTQWYLEKDWGLKWCDVVKSSSFVILFLPLTLNCGLRRHRRVITSMLSCVWPGRSGIRPFWYSWK